MTSNNRYLLSGFRAAAVSALLLVLSSCTSEPPKAPPKSEPAKPITGRSAFYKVFPVARQWSSDAQGIQMTSIQLPGITGPAGTAGAWQVVFASVNLHKMKTFTWSADDAPGNLKKGVFQSDEQEFTGKLDQAVPFFPQALHVDSDEAFQALGVPQKGSEPINFLLELKPQRYPDLAWRVLWGESVGTASKTGYVDATSGKVLERVR